jgi:uncharacterized membrane-anchored protein
MNKRYWIWLAFAVVVVAQLAVPAAMILSHERTLKEGQVFKFKTRPVDPADAFRGRYVWLSLEPNAVKLPDANQWRYGRKAFAVLGTDSNGFAIITRLERTLPADKPAVRVRTMWADVKKGEVHIDWPGLDRYYMAESKAPAAETAYRKHSDRTNQACHVTVRIRGAQAAIENLFIEDRPIRAWLNEHKGS